MELPNNAYCAAIVTLQRNQRTNIAIVANGA